MESQEPQLRTSPTLPASTTRISPLLLGGLGLLRLLGSVRILGHIAGILALGVGCNGSLLRLLLHLRGAVPSGILLPQGRRPARLRHPRGRTQPALPPKGIQQMAASTKTALWLRGSMSSNTVAEMLLSGVAEMLLSSVVEQPLASLAEVQN